MDPAAAGLTTTDSAPPRARILVVEDHPLTGPAIQQALAMDGFEVELAGTLARARARFEAGTPDIVILDVHLPDGSGLSLCSHFRQTTSVPIIVVSGADTVEDRIAGFDAGADDYVVKPIHIAELSRRVDAVLRRAGVRPAEAVLYGSGGMELHLDSGEARRGGASVRITRSEVGILRALLIRNGVPVQPDDLCREVWGYSALADANFIQQHVSRLRRKLHKIDAGDLIQTAYGVGYVIPARTSSS
ncbi:MAG: response regulator transcription factor [Stagnimonas sp.]|nr:response regulator transcription factor [Stagnimonas sp.]